MTETNDFQTWWDNEGSGMAPKDGEELSVFMERVTRIAWSNGACKSDELLLKIGRIVIENKNNLSRDSTMKIFGDRNN